MAENNNPFEGTDLNIPPQIKNLLGNVKGIAIAVAAFILVFASFYTVEPEEVGVVQRFGEYQRTAEPGLNFKIPFVETTRIVPVERQLKQEFGYRTVQSGVQTTYTKAGYVDESLMLTGDLNLADVEWVVQYRISDPYNYLFKIRNPEQTLRDMSEAAMREVVGNRTVNEVLTIGRASVAARVQEILQELNAEYESGIQIEQVVLQDINPPDPVKPSFNAVNEAQQQRETLINQAESDYNRVIPRARGEAEQTIQQAEGYAINRTNTAEGEVAAFVQLHQEYTLAPEITKKRIYFETLQELLPTIGTKVITDQDGANVLPLLQMQMDGVRNVSNQNNSNNN
jgi:membrane protease subunit HflK